MAHGPVVLAYSCGYLIVSLLWLALFAALAKSVTWKTLALVFLAGGAVALPVAFVSEELRSLLPSYTAGIRIREFLLYFAVVGPVEEGGKFLAAFAIVLRKRDFSTTLDGVLVAAVAGLGFAALENMLYLAAYGLPATLPRLILGNLGHAAFSIFWGYSFGIVLHEGAPAGSIAWGLVLAALLHGAYDYLLIISPYVAPSAFVLSAGLYWFVLRLIRSERARPSRGATR